MRVDAHHHLWDLQATPQPWIEPEWAAIDRSFTPDDFAAVAADFIDQSILVQTVSAAEETPLLLSYAASSALIGGVVGWVDLTAADVADRLDELRADPNGAYLRGVRHQVQSEPDPRWLCRPEVKAGLVELAERDLVYELLLVPSQLPAAVEVVRECTEVRFVLDHLSKPPIASGALEPWATEIAALAAAPNVVAKLSGLVTEAEWSAWTIDDLAPYVEVAIERFGPDRLMFGSDWPVCGLAASYGEVVAAATTLTEGLTVAEREAVFGDNAMQTYRLPAP